MGVKYFKLKKQKHTTKLRICSYDAAVPSTGIKHKLFVTCFYINNPDSILVTSLLTYLCLSITLSTYCLIKICFYSSLLLLYLETNNFVHTKRQQPIHGFIHLFFLLWWTAKATVLCRVFYCKHVLTQQSSNSPKRFTTYKVFLVHLKKRN